MRTRNLVDKVCAVLACYVRVNIGHVNERLLRQCPVNYIFFRARVCIHLCRTLCTYSRIVGKTLYTQKESTDP